jgi:hypothetical protein
LLLTEIKAGHMAPDDPKHDKCLDELNKLQEDLQQEEDELKDYISRKKSLRTGTPASTP